MGPRADFLLSSRKISSTIELSKVVRHQRKTSWGFRKGHVMFHVQYCFCLILAIITLHLHLGETAHADVSVPLTLKQALSLAVQNNLEIRAERYNPALREAELQKNLAIYDPLVHASAYYRKSHISSVATAPSLGESHQQNASAEIAVEQLTPLGGVLGLSFANLWSRGSDYSARGLLSRYWQSELALTYVQPLLKNFGREPTELGIAVSSRSKDAAGDHYVAVMLGVVDKVRTAYFVLRSLSENLRAKQATLTLARKILDDTRGRVRAGTLPAMDILSAEFGVVTREKESLDAEKAFQDQQDYMQQLLQLPEGQVVVPVDPPVRTPIDIDEIAAVAKALTTRPDLRAQREVVAIAELEARVARSRTLPDLALTVSGALAGLDKGYDRITEQVGSAEYPAWGVGLQFAYPLGNRAARNDSTKAALSAAQARVQFRRLEDTVRTEVRRAVRAVKTSFLQLAVADRGLAFGEERFRAYLGKRQVGLATTREVFDVQNDLVAAEAQRIRAEAEYAIALGQLWLSTGELLAQEGVDPQPGSADALYRSHHH